ncbi:MAG: hypothetical protein JWP06_358 [Candidatus Saccharibacteria bacterium]|nr:hypothetical protein [Candidatus Saccharibacteria bacterium]
MLFACPIRQVETLLVLYLSKIHIARRQGEPMGKKIKWSFLRPQRRTHPDRVRQAHELLASLLDQMVGNAHTMVERFSADYLKDEWREKHGAMLTDKLNVGVAAAQKSLDALEGEYVKGKRRGKEFDLQKFREAYWHGSSEVLHGLEHVIQEILFDYDGDCRPMTRLARGSYNTVVIRRDLGVEVGFCCHAFLYMIGRVGNRPKGLDLRMKPIIPIEAGDKFG